MTASQPEIDAACMALTEAANNLEGHEFVAPVINVKNGDTVLEETALVQVPEDTQSATLSLALNDGAMVKSVNIASSEENNATASVNGNNVTITKTGETGSLKLTVTVVDDWDREITKTYTLNLINVIIPVTSLVLTVDGTAVTGSNMTVSAGGRYTRFNGVQIGYIPTPADANAITSVSYKLSNTTQFEIDGNGKLTLTALGKISTASQLSTTVTVTVTNADGSTAEAHFDLLVTKA